MPTPQREIDDAQQKIKNISDSVRWFKNQLYIEQNRRIAAEDEVKRLKEKYES